MKRHNRSVSRQRALPLRAVEEVRLIDLVQCKVNIGNWMVSIVTRKYGGWLD